MEIKTCEQYVLVQLYEQQDENDRLCRELECRDKRIAELETEIKTIEAAHDSTMQEAIREAGRKELYDKCTGYGASVKDEDGVMAFDNWCVENVRKYSLPDGITVLDFIKEFAAELRADYDERLAEVSE
ncbi:hypothetical protein [Paratractidigestivibacter sp.]|uniref:hypothetical protein n=1 Tax=Paratractidigestivibacter sp. TaxID=2847316 RepID=UPI002AC92B49|nr:hypothetical protein [Paratractidigestivibacter sp.]